MHLIIVILVANMSLLLDVYIIPMPKKCLVMVVRLNFNLPLKLPDSILSQNVKAHKRGHMWKKLVYIIYNITLM